MPGASTVQVCTATVTPSSASRKRPQPPWKELANVIGDPQNMGTSHV